MNIPASRLKTHMVAALATPLLGLIRWHGEPVVLYLLGALGFPIVALKLVPMEIRKAHRQYNRALAVWYGVGGFGFVVLGLFYLLSFVIAIRTAKGPGPIFWLFLTGMAILVLSLIGSAIIYPKGRTHKEQPGDYEI